MNDKNINRYSYSRLSTFKKCPRMHHYIYVEGIETQDSEYVIPGKLFHQCVESILRSEDQTPFFEEFKKQCMSGKLNLEPDLLEYIVTLYFQYYSDDYFNEQTLLIEKEYTDTLEGNDSMALVVDQAYEKNDMLIVRDIKTTTGNLKYTFDTVKNNQQLLLYVPYVENDLKKRVSAIEIDEVRFAKLQPVPLKNNNKPSTDKRLLSLVTYEAYYDMLCSLGLENEKEYQPILEYLEQRGHPLFRRTTVQILDDNVVAENIKDIMDTYHACQQDFKFTVRGPLCNYCNYKELCDLDQYNPDSGSREMMIQKINL